LDCDHRLRQLLERLFFFALFDDPAYLRNKGLVSGVGRQAVGITAFARPKAGGLRAIEAIV